jgi:hypothetical protein
MNGKNFLENYLWPSEDKLDRTFTHPLPNIEGLKKCGDFIVQSEHEETFSTNIMTKYVSDTLGIRLVEVYKNTQNKATGVFVRLVGTMGLVKVGYPFLILDAGIRNVSRLTPQREDIATRVTIHLPQVDPSQRSNILNSYNEQAKEAGISYRATEEGDMPDFWGPRWIAESKGGDLDMIRQIRVYAWNSYKGLIEKTKERIPFDYKPLQEYMIFGVSMREHLSFNISGMSVPTEAQAAFFSVMVSVT